MVVLGTIVVVAVLWLIFRPAFLEPETDFVDLAPDYTAQVGSLLAGDGFVSFRYPPLFPLMLAGVARASSVTGIDDGLIGALLILVFALCGSILTYRLGNRVWGAPWGLLCVGLWLIYPIFWRLWLQPLSEAPFVVLVLASVLGIMNLIKRQDPKTWIAVGVGVLLGLSMLTRPSAIGLPVVFGIYLLTRGKWSSPARRGLVVASIVAVTAITVAPWEIHAWRTTGKVIPLSTGGVPTLLDGLTYAVDPSESRPVWVPDAVRSLQWEIHENSYQELNSLGSVTAFLLSRLQSDTVAVLQLFAIKAARAWYGTDSGAYDRWLLLLQIPVVVVLLLAFFRCSRSAPPVRSAALLVGLVVVYFWLMTTAVLSIVRYMVPALALMVAVAPAVIGAGAARSVPER